MYSTHTHTHSGFSLIEMMVAISLFSVMAVLAIGAMMSILDANRKARLHQAVLNDVSLAVEKMTREIRDGKGIDTGNCDLGSCEFKDRYWTAGDPSSEYFVQYDAVAKVNRVYRDDVSHPVTGPDVDIENLTFTLLTASGATQHPGVVMTLQGIAGKDTENETEFHIETVVSQALSDLAARQGTTIVNPATFSTVGANADTGTVTVSTDAEVSRNMVVITPVPKPGDDIDFPISRVWCPWETYAVPADWRIVPIQKGKGEIFGLYVRLDRETNVKIISNWYKQNNRAVWCTPWEATNDIERCDVEQGGSYPNKSAGMIRFEADAALLMHDQSKTGGGTLNGFDTATCQLKQLANNGSGVITSLGSGLDLASIGANYTVWVVTEDMGHCRTWDTNDPPVCTTWWNQGQNEAVRLIFKDVTGAIIGTTGFTDQIADDQTGTISNVGTIHVSAGEIIDSVEIEIREHKLYADDGHENVNEILPGLGESLDLCLNDFGSVQAPYNSSDPAYPTVSLGVGCFAIGTSPPPVSGTMCDIGWEQCSVGSNKCKPIGSGMYVKDGSGDLVLDGLGNRMFDFFCWDGTGPESNYCPSVDASYDLMTGVMVGGVPKCQVTGPGSSCAATEVNINGYCIPNVGVVSCDPVGRPDLYCATGEECSPDGQCFVGGGLQNIATDQDTEDRQEF